MADFFVTEKMLQHFIKQAHSNSFMRQSPRVLVCVPVGATSLNAAQFVNPRRALVPVKSS
ncbi:hypothetical protein DMI62_20130 [Escherichia coli]|nr:hypothetical protein [Escherichia coli]